MNSSLPLFDRGEIVRSTVDICESRHRGNAESQAAHDKVVPTKTDTWKKIMNLISSRGEFGATSKEIAYAMGKQLHAISGRCSELKAMGWIKPTELRREGSAVLILNEAKSSQLNNLVENQGPRSASVDRRLTK